MDAATASLIFGDEQDAVLRWITCIGPKTKGQKHWVLDFAL
jgi:hypothetical protein